ncbi:MAG: serine hydrolase [Planctomycetales bacterium]|nr:serine hydrolase [Planctomycetales bacterium]
MSRMLCGLVAIVFTSLAAAEQPAYYFPPTNGESGNEWETIAPAKAGWDETKLQTALNFAGENRSSGVVILHRGRILAEQYWEVGGPMANAYRERVLVGQDGAGRAIEDVASAQKSVVAILVGMAQQRGLLQLNEPVDKYLGQGWSAATPEQERAITIRHLITMTSGLNEEREYEAPPGAKWSYNTTVYAQTMLVLEKATKQDRNALTKQWLTGPRGMADSRWVRRRAANVQAVNAYGFATTARDLARFGLFALAEGSWQGKPVLDDRDFLRQATTTSQSLNPFYGYLWWVNRDAKQPQRRRTSTAPADMFSANGALNRRCFVVPSLELVVTRLGVQPAGNRAFDQRLWELLMAAAPNTDAK